MTQGNFKERIIRQFSFALKDPNPNIRFLALEGLHLSGGIAETASLLPLLSDKDRFVKWKAIQVAGFLGLEPAIPILEKSLASPELNTRWFATQALSALGNPRELPPLLALMKTEPAPRVRQALVRNLYLFGDKTPWDFLQQSVRDADLGVRIDSAMVLGRMAPDQNACDLLINLLEQESNNHVFATALLSLGRFRKLMLMGYFQHSLLHQESRIRANAIEALGQLPFKEVAPLVAPYLRDPSNRVKANVMCIYFQNGEAPRMAPELAKLLNSKNRWERASGAWLVGTFRLSGKVPQLIKLLQDEEPVVAERSAWAMGLIKFPEAFVELWKAYFHANQWAQPNILTAMGQVATTEDVPPLLTLLAKERAPQLKAQIIDILTALRCEDAQPTIMPFRDDPDHRIRASAFVFLGTIGGLAAGDLLLEGLQDPNTRVRAVCAEIMLRAGDFRALKVLSTLLNESDKLQRVQAAHTLREIGQLTRSLREGGPQ